MNDKFPRLAYATSDIMIQVETSNFADASHMESIQNLIQQAAIVADVVHKPVLIVVRNRLVGRQYKYVSQLTQQLTYYNNHNHLCFEGGGEGERVEGEGGGNLKIPNIYLIAHQAR